MSEYKCRGENNDEIIEAEPAPLGWLQEQVSPGLATLVVCGLLTICVCGIASGKSISMKLGPLMLNVA